MILLWEGGGLSCERVKYGRIPTALMTVNALLEGNYVAMWFEGRGRGRFVTVYSFVSFDTFF